MATSCILETWMRLSDITQDREYIVFSCSYATKYKGKAMSGIEWIKDGGAVLAIIIPPFYAPKKAVFVTSFSTRHCLFVRQDGTVYSSTFGRIKNDQSG